MKNISLFVLLIASYSNSFTQDIIKLDELSGFNKFILGENISTYQKQIKPFTTKYWYDTTEFHYKYVGRDINKAFNAKVDSIELVFYKKILYKIRIDLSFDNPYQFDGIINDLKTKYGEPKANPMNGSIGFYGYSWKGEKIILQISSLEPEKKSTITFESSVIRDKRYYDGF